MRLLKNKNGQSTLEYVIVLSAIVAAVVIGAAVVKDKILNEDGMFDTAGEKITDYTGRLPGVE